MKIKVKNFGGNLYDYIYKNKSAGPLQFEELCELQEQFSEQERWEVLYLPAPKIFKGGRKKSA